MLTEKDYCDYETCVALKELGYDGTQGECSHFGAFYMNGAEIFYDRFYNSELQENECLRVPLYLAQKWLREEKKLFVEITLGAFDQTYLWEIYNTENSDLITGGFSSYDTYEEALSEGVRASIKILQDEQKENN